jgi:hypothetical protein
LLREGRGFEWIKLRIKRRNKDVRALFFLDAD